MAEAPENIVLVYLRRIDEKVDRIGERLDLLTSRVGSLEQQVASLRTDIVPMQVRMDHFGQPVSRIERRLDVVEV